MPVGNVQMSTNGGQDKCPWCNPPNTFDQCTITTDGDPILRSDIVDAWEIQRLREENEKLKDRNRRYLKVIKELYDDILHEY